MAAVKMLAYVCVNFVAKAVCLKSFFGECKTVLFKDYFRVGYLGFNRQAFI